VYEQIYPVGTYSNLALLVVVFLITDFVRHKPVIIADAALGIGIYSLLIWGQGIPIMQVCIPFKGQLKKMVKLNY